MPAITPLARTLPARSLRILIAVLCLALVATAVAAGDVEAKGKSRAKAKSRDLTPLITATRRSQLYYESVMKAADRDVRSQKRAQKQAKRKLKTAQRRLRRVSAYRRDVRADLVRTRTRMHAARAALAASPLEAPPPPDLALAALVLQDTRRSAADRRSTVVLAHQGERGRLDAAAGSAGRPFFPTIAPATSSLEVSVADVVRLQKKTRKHKRQLRSAKRWHQRAVRNVRVKRRAVAAAKARHRYAIARREGAEGALASRILSMSSLAQRRAANWTDVRPGIDSGFAWPARGRITQTYGCTGFGLNPARGGCRGFHDGLDIASYRGAPIRAAATGVVSYIGWNPWDQHGRAFMIVVSHAGGFETLYGHVLPTRRVRVGELVKKGHVIGYMGSTGNSTGTHLHFELRRGRTTINPLGYL